MGKNIWAASFFRSRVPRERVTILEMLFGYFLGPFCVLAMTSVVSSYYLTYYRTFEDIVAQKTVLTLLPMLSVIPMAAANIVIGIILGKTKTSQGKARPYIFAAAPLLLISGLLLFYMPDVGIGVRILWMVITFNLFAAIANPIYGSAHYLMVSLSTRNLEERGKLSVVANIPAVAGNGLVSSILMPVILSWINTAETVSGVQDRWQLVMSLFAFGAFAGCILEYLYTRERITEEDSGPGQCCSIQEQKISVFTQLRQVVKDRYWWIIMIFYMLYQAGVMFKSGYVFNIFCHEFLTSAEILGKTISADLIQSVLALISGIPLAAGMLFIWPLANRFGKRNVVLAGCAVSILGSGVCLLAPHNFIVMLVGQTLKGISSIPGAYIMMALFADVLDHLEAKLGYRVDGITMSFYNTIITVINGLAIAFFNFFYDHAAFAQTGVTKFFFLEFEIFSNIILIFVLSFLTVEKHIKEEQTLIRKRKEKGEEKI